VPLWVPVSVLALELLVLASDLWALASVLLALALALVSVLQSVAGKHNYGLHFAHYFQNGIEHLPDSSLTDLGIDRYSTANRKCTGKYGPH
jgi:hypothetical protein